MKNAAAADAADAAGPLWNVSEKASTEEIVSEKASAGENVRKTKAKGMRHLWTALKHCARR